jgi:uncharacterized protein YpmB
MHIRKQTKKVIIIIVTIIIIITIAIPLTQIYSNSNNSNNNNSTQFLFMYMQIIQFNSILYYLCAEPTATRPITGTAQCSYK